MRRLLPLLLLTPVLLLPTSASAGWYTSGSGSAGVAVTTMTNASDFTAACSGSDKVVLSWTISPSTYVDRYKITRTSDAGVVASIEAAGRTTSTTTDRPPIPVGGAVMSYTYTIQASNGQTWITPAVAAQRRVRFTRAECTLV